MSFEIVITDSFERSAKSGCQMSITVKLEF